MMVIPAIDVSRGRCVRLLRGARGTEAVYGNDPVEMARFWEAEGAGMLHVVDLDAAFGHPRSNRGIIERMIREVRVPVQVGGGVRDDAAFEGAVAAGAARVVFGTAAVENPETVRKALARHVSRVVVGVDVRDTRVVIRGWEEQSEKDPIEFAKLWTVAGVRRFVYTDVHHDGSLEGPDIEAVADFARETGAEVIASGGVGSLDDLRRLAGARLPGLSGVIVGKALYEQRFTLGEAMEAVRG
jgi:phosphoribosylformimino-5-aminoimidazole carboxamide ribotide isomerase